jgi:hypothetical protein
VKTEFPQKIMLANIRQAFANDRPEARKRGGWG